MYSRDEQEAKPAGRCWVLYVMKLRAHSFNPAGIPMIGRATTTQDPAQFSEQQKSGPSTPR
jgi:hypothetical protein